MVKEIDVLFPTIKSMDGFCRLSSVSDCHPVIHAGKYLLDASDLMNLFSLDMTNAVRVRIEGSERSVFLLLDAYERAGVLCQTI